jgi:endoglucanase
MDSSSISDARLVQFCKQLAQARNIPYQLEILPRGGTDAGAIQRARAGVPVMTISVPTRYAHSVIEAVHKRDVQASIDLVTAFIEEVHRF